MYLDSSVYDDDFYDDDPEPMRKPVSGKDTDNAEEDKVRKITPKVTPLRQTKKMGAGMEVCVIKPTTVEDAREITETLLANRTVVLNLESTNKDIARRLIDFLSGVAYAGEGKIKKVAANTYIITPYHVDIEGDLIDELENNGLYL